MYYFHWPLNYSGEWQYGYKQAVEFVKSRYNDVDYVLVTKSQARPYIYFLLYMKFDPRIYWQSAQIVKDRFFFIDVEGFDKFRFTDSFDQSSVSGKILYVASPGQLPSFANKLKTIIKLNKTEVFEIGEATIK